MINLIPHEAKRSIVKEYWVRVCSVWMLLWAFALLCGVSIILPSYVLINTQVDVYTAPAAEASEKVADYKNASKVLIESSQQARIIVDGGREQMMSDLVLLFRSLQGDAVQISGMSILRNEEGIAPVQLEGVAENRQALASFRDRLLEQSNITVVDLPISNLARDRDIQFAITITMNNQTES